MNETFGFQAVAHDNLGEVVYGQLSEALIRGRFAPGARLTIRDLAQSLGTSVTPVRDAILRLIQDEALVQKSAREVRVPVMTLERYLELRQIRVKLEGLGAREVEQLAVDLLEIPGIVEAQQAAVDRGFG